MKTLFGVVKGGGYPLVLFHGWGFDHHIWSSVMPQLTKQYQVYCFDLPGFGQTPMMPWKAFKETLLARLPARFAVLGWSMGGLWATRLALEVPQQVTHLVNVTSSPCFIHKPQWPGIDPLVFETFYQQVIESPDATLQQFIDLQLPSAQQGGVWNSPPMNPVGLRSGLELLLSADLRTALSTIKLPVSYLFGRLDAIVPRTLMVKMQRLYPHFNYHLFEKAAHLPFLSHSDEFITKINEFL